MENVIIWNAKRFAKLVDSLRKESTKDERIGSGNGYLTAPVRVTVNETAYNVRAVVSYASAMGAIIENDVTGASILIVTDENHSMTTTTAQHIGRMCRDNGFLNRYNLYPTRGGYEANIGGCRTPYTRDRKDWRADAENGYTEFFRDCHDKTASLSAVLDAVNADGIRHTWNRVG